MLKFDSVSIGYHKVPLIKNLSVEIPTGSITTIVGPNGCGKTTLISVLNKSSQLFNGSITLDGEDIYHMNGHLRARKIAFLPQIREVIPALPVHTLVEHGRFPYLGFSRRLTEEDRRLVEDAMEFTHITDYRNVATDTLSGGIRQRVFFAMTLAQNCDTIILDEPTASNLKGTGKNNSSGAARPCQGTYYFRQTYRHGIRYHLLSGHSG